VPNEWSVAGIFGQICNFFLGRYTNVLKDRGETSETIKDGARSIGRELFVFQFKHIFYQRKIHYLRHIISEEGVVVDLENIGAIRG
jgi:hypothetical protein